MLQFRHNEITVNILGIVLTFMTYLLVFRWYGDHFSKSIYLNGWTHEPPLTHMQTHLTSANDIFRDIQLFITLYRSLGFLTIDSNRQE